MVTTSITIYVLRLYTCTSFVGFETYIAAAWKRLMSEIIDTVVFTLLLKAYLPDADLRCVGRVCVCVCMCV